MSKRNSVKTKKERQTETRNLTNTTGVRIRHALPYRPNYKRTIELFFNSEKLHESTRPVMKLNDLIALLDESRREVEDQITEHKRTLRKRGHRDRS
jgi:hypothetical protein